MLDYVIMCPTYNRAPKLRQIVEHLSAEAKADNLNICMIIVDDHSEDMKAYRSIVRDLKRPKFEIMYSRLSYNHGRDDFWRVWTLLFQKAKTRRYEYAIGLADDMVLCQRFLQRITRAFEFCRKQDPMCVAMNTFARFPINWGSIRYLDGAFIANPRFLTVLNYRVKEIKKSTWKGHRRNRSSGVGKQITERIRRSKYNIAPVAPISYMIERNGDSALYPRERFPDRPPMAPWPENFIDEI